MDHLVWTKQFEHEFAFIRPIQSSSTPSPPHSPPPPSLPQAPASSPVAAVNDANDLYDSSFVACAWDGQTFVVNKEGEILKFFIEDSIAAFALGRFEWDAKKWAFQFVKAVVSYC